jgi:tetratricopeptide (TPR) repeat protein
MAKDRLDEAVDAFDKALRLKPNDPLVLNNLGNALVGKGLFGKAVAKYREALRHKPDYPLARFNLGNAFKDQGDMDRAITEYRAALAIDPNCFPAHHNLGLALRVKGQWDEAVTALRAALRLKPDDPLARFNLSIALVDKGIAFMAKDQLDEAIAAYREALRLRPNYPLAHYNLGNVFKANGQLDDAIAVYQEALRLKPDYPEAHCNLGLALRDKGQFTAALTSLRRGDELGKKDQRWKYRSDEWVKQCERLVALDSKLPDILSGTAQPASDLERAEYAHVCYYKRLYATAVRLFQGAITASPALVASPDNGLRYKAACAAALAGGGAGEEAAQLTDTKRAELRGQALDWLWADLEAWRGRLDQQPDKTRPVVTQKMRHWLRDLDFNGVRGPDALGKLPEAERQPWQQLWLAVETLGRRAAEPR